MTTIDAFHLPAVGDGTGEWTHLEAGRHVLRWPRLTPDTVARLVAHLRTAQQTLIDVPVARVIATIDHAAGRLLDRDDPLRRTAEDVLPTLTGYSAPMIRLILDRMAADWTTPNLQRLIDAELGGSDILERPVHRGGRRTMATPWPVVTHVFAGNVPGVAVTSLVRALLVRSASLGKTALGEPLLPALFARAVAAHDPVIGNALAVCHWPGGDDEIEAVAFATDAIIAYGGGHTLGSIIRRSPPGTPVLDHGPRLSIGFVGRDALHDEAAARTLAASVATAVATFDQQGCVSPHAVFVEDDDAASRVPAFAALVAEALATLETRLPRGTISSDQAAAIRAARTRAEFSEFSGAAVRLVSPGDAPFTVLLHEDHDFEPSCLLRTVHIHPVPAIGDALERLAVHRALLQSAGVAGLEETAIRAIARTGFTRITSFEHMAWPDPAGHHDGRGPLRELLRMTDVEE